MGTFVLFIGLIFSTFFALRLPYVGNGFYAVPKNPNHSANSTERHFSRSLRVHDIEPVVGNDRVSFRHRAPTKPTKYLDFFLQNDII